MKVGKFHRKSSKLITPLTDYSQVLWQPADSRIAKRMLLVLWTMLLDSCPIDRSLRVVYESPSIPMAQPKRTRVAIGNLLSIVGTVSPFWGISFQAVHDQQSSEIRKWSMRTRRKLNNWWPRTYGR